MTESTETLPAPKQLTAPQRRVLGVLAEKAFTTPEYYPLTLKALTAGCNQKSNRAPLTQYDESEVEETLDQLREMGLVAIVHTESGRTERYRHYLRKRFPFTEPQLAVFTELLLRGRQQLGELRSRASRMVPIESLDELREALEGLIRLGLVATDGPLERRGVQVDHTLYTDAERSRKPQILTTPVSAVRPEEEIAAQTAPAQRPEPSVSGAEELAGRIETLEADVAQVRSTLASLGETVEQLRDRLDALCRELGSG